MSNEIIFRGRSDAIHMTQIPVPIWDLVPMNVWERYVYIELCSWAGINADGEWICFSPLTLARKYRISDPEYKEDTVRKKIYKAIIGLEEKRIITTRPGRDNMKQLFLNDLKLCSQKNWYKQSTMKLRSKLYKKYE